MKLEEEHWNPHGISTVINELDFPFKLTWVLMSLYTRHSIKNYFYFLFYFRKRKLIFFILWFAFSLIVINFKRVEKSKSKSNKKLLKEFFLFFFFSCIISGWKLLSRMQLGVGCMATFHLNHLATNESILYSNIKFYIKQNMFNEIYW